MTSLRDIELPPTFWEARSRLHAVDGLIMLSGGDVLGEVATDDSLRRIAQQMQAATVLPLLSGLSVLTSSKPPTEIPAVHQQQLQAVHELLPEKVARRAAEFIESGLRDAFVSEEQVLVAMRVMIEAGQRGPARPVDTDTLGRLLLGVNDVLLVGTDGASAEERAIRIGLRRQTVTPMEQHRYALARWYDLVLQRAAAARGAADWIDIDAMFEEATGLPIIEHMGFCHAYSAPFSEIKEPADLQRAGFHTVLARFEAQIRDATKADFVRAQMVDTIDGHRERFRSRRSVYALSTMLPFFKRPLLRLDNGSILPVSVPLILHRGTVGIFHILLEHASKTGGDAAVNNLTAFFGRLHQEYLSDLLARFCRPGAPSKAVFFDEQAVMRESGTNQRPPFDGVLIEGDTVALVEMYAGSLRLDTVESADPRFLERDFERDFKRKVHQLADGVNGILDGTWRVPGLGHNEIRTVLPVLALLHPFPQFVGIYEYFGTAFQERVASCPGAAVLPVQIVADEEFEMLEAPLPLPILTVLRRRAENLVSLRAPLRSVLLKEWALPPAPNPHVGVLYWKAARAFRAAIQATVELNFQVGPASE